MKLTVSVMAAAIGCAVLGSSGTAAADATDDYPIPHRMIETSCSAEQIMAATRDVKPVYYERYMIDYNNKSPQVQQWARDRIHWFYAQTPQQRRAYSEDMATNIYAEDLTFAWPNWAKLFWNNKGVVAASTEVCAEYPTADMSVWKW